MAQRLPCTEPQYGHGLCANCIWSSRSTIRVTASYNGKSVVIRKSLQLNANNNQTLLDLLDGLDQQTDAPLSPSAIAGTPLSISADRSLMVSPSLSTTSDIYVQDWPSILDTDPLQFLPLWPRRDNEQLVQESAVPTHHGEDTSTNATDPLVGSGPAKDSVSDQVLDGKNRIYLSVMSVSSNLSCL